MCSCMGWVDCNTLLWLARPLEEGRFGEKYLDFCLICHRARELRFVPELKRGWCWVPGAGGSFSRAGEWLQQEHGTRDCDIAALPWEATRCPSGTSGTHHIEECKGYHTVFFFYLRERAFDEFLVCSLQLFSKVVGITSCILSIRSHLRLPHFPTRKTGMLLGPL